MAGAIKGEDFVVVSLTSETANKARAASFLTGALGKRG
jgi:hypothetical protein